MKIFILISLLSTSAWANYQISVEKTHGVQITQTVSPDPATCQALGDIKVSIHQPGSNTENLAKAAKEKGGNFVFIRSDSPYYSYTYGGELYNCQDSLSATYPTYKK